MTAHLKKDNVEKALLFDDGIFKYVIYMFKDGTAKYAPMTTEILAGTAKNNIPMVSVGNLANG